MRFVLRDARLQSRCKDLRHQLTQAVAGVHGLPVARDATRDPGRTAQRPEEYQRSGLSHIVRANLGRASQSLRTLEEYGKLLDKSLAESMEQIRYSVYELEKSVLNTIDSQQRLQNVQLCVLIDGCRDESHFGSVVSGLIAGGAGMVQLRDKRLDDRQLMSRGRRLAELARDAGILSIINDRSDVAVACQADGVHVGQDDLPVTEARRIVGVDRLVGVSTHCLADARQAVDDGANYIGVGPVFESSTKSFDSFPGLELVVDVANEIALPAFAIGGINPDNLARVLDAGIERIAVSGAVPMVDPGQTREAVVALNRRLQQLSESGIAESRHAGG